MRKFQKLSIPRDVNLLEYQKANFTWETRYQQRYLYRNTNLGSTYMNYPRFHSSKHSHFPKGVMAIVKFIPLVPFMAQVADTDIDTWKFMQTN